MVRLRLLALLALGTLAGSSIGCAADSESAAPSGEEQGTGGEGEDEIRAALLGNVSAVKINGGAPVAASGKVRRILANIGLGAGAPRPEEGGYRCMPSYRLQFLDAKGEEKGYAGFLCGGPGSSDRKNAKGTVHVGGKSYLISAQDVDALDAIAKEPLAVGDVIFGADRAEITRRVAGTKLQVSDGALVAKLVKAFKSDEVPDPMRPMPRCLPNSSVTLFKGNARLAGISYSCGEAARDTIAGSFSSEGGAHGAASINNGVVLDVEAALKKN